VGRRIGTIYQVVVYVSAILDWREIGRDWRAGWRRRKRALSIGFNYRIDLMI
jgi:hypothetical protein